MQLTITVRTSRLKSGKWPPNTDAFAHLPERQWHEEPRRVVPIRPGPGRDAEDVAAAVFRVEPFAWEAPEDFWTLSPDDAAALVINAVRILDLPPSFDEEGSPGYDKEMWARAMATLLEGAIWMWSQFGDRVPAPAIGPGPNGSIDLDWYKGERTLLLNFPSDPHTPPTFYGDDGDGGFPLEGELDLNKENNWLFVWLAQK